ncbi:MAG: trypsin-like peptidase domain-containing protein [Anaerolineae bacterium]
MRKLILTALLLLAACQSTPDAPPPQAVASTPIADLPISLNQQFQLPTAVPADVVREADAEYLLLTNIYERVAPSVVNVEVVETSVNQLALDLGRGSGFIYDLNGHIITNAHVVSGAETIRVTFNDGFIADAELVGTDIFSDLAVIRIDVPVGRLNPLPLADSDLVRVGERAIAIGNPFGLSSSMTVGIVSALGRQLDSAELIDASVLPGFQNPQIIQVDTDINPGNSGGPLLNSFGEVIGVNTAIRTESGVFEGVGFAVPSNTIQRVIPELIDQGRVNYAWIGITAESSDRLSMAALSAALNLPVDEGVLISGVMPESPAAKAGLRGGNTLRVAYGQQVCTGGDIILAVNGEYVRDMDDLVAYLVLNTAPGDTISVLIVRDNETFEVPVTLEPRPTSGTSPQCQ